MHNTKPRNLFPSVRSICSYYSTGKYLVNTAGTLIKLMSKNNQLNQPGSLMYAMCDQLILLLTECGKMEELQEAFISVFPWNRNNCNLFESGVLNKLLTIVIVIKHQGKYCKLKYISVLFCCCCSTVQMVAAVYCLLIFHCSSGLILFRYFYFIL